MMCPLHTRVGALCGPCVVDAIKQLQNDTWTINYLKEEHNIILHPETIQIVLDTLEQKFDIC